jgi:acetyl-CoA acetyltransferase
MKTSAVVAGVGMTKFGKHLDRGLKSLACEAISQALRDAAVEPLELQAAYMANAAASIITGQVCVPGQVVLRGMGMGRLPVVNVENACASASTAFQQACAMITAGAYDVVLACGYEKLYHEDKQKSFAAFTGSVDVENLNETMLLLQRRISAIRPGSNTEDAGKSHSMFMDIYAATALEHMEKYGTTQRQFAAVSSKNSFHSSLNPRAQYQDVLSVQDVLAARQIVYPLTLPMCCPVGDGAAAVVLVSEKKARHLGIEKPVRVLSSVLHSGWDYAEHDTETVTQLASREAYEHAGVGPQDIECAEVHDASAPAELLLSEALQFCPQGEGGRFVEEGCSRLGGRLPINTSGGLLRKGHPIGATGIAQIVELTEQLQGRCGRRQVNGARVGLAENAGGYIGQDAAAMVVTIVAR